MTYEHLSFRVAHDFCTRLDERKKRKIETREKCSNRIRFVSHADFFFFLSFHRCCCCSYYSSRIIYFRTFGCFTSEKTKCICMHVLAGWLAVAYIASVERRFPPFVWYSMFTYLYRCMYECHALFSEYQYWK